MENEDFKRLVTHLLYFEFEEWVSVGGGKILKFKREKKKYIYIYISSQVRETSNVKCESEYNSVINIYLQQSCYNLGRSNIFRFLVLCF